MNNRKQLIIIISSILALLTVGGVVIGVSLSTSPSTPAPQQYTINFVADGQVVGTVKTAGNQTITLPTAPSKTDYTFVGWFFDQDTWQQQLTETYYANQALTKDISVYAYYKLNDNVPPKEYTVNFVTNGGTAVSSMTTSVIETEPQTTQSGYTLLGWYKESNYITKVNFPYTVTYDQTLYAKWEKTKYTVNFVTNGGSYVASMTTSRIEVQPQTTQSGYTFLGWYKESNFITKVTFPYEVTKNQTLYAKWEKTKYTVDFVTNGGSAVKSITTDTISSSPKTTQDGYTFLGWYSESNFINEVTFPYSVTYNQTLYAKWEKNKYTVHFVTGEGSAVDDMYTSRIESSPNSTRNGYALVGWYTEESLENKVNFPYDVTHEQTLYAKWEVEKYIVTFDAQGGSPIESMNTYRIETEPKTTLDGYKFLGWYTDRAFNNLVEFPYDVTSHQTLYAKWQLVDQSVVEYVVTPEGQLTAVNNLLGRDIDLVIPSVVDGITITSFKNALFQANTKLRSVELPDTATSISQSMFELCSNLQTVVLPNNLKTIGNSAFKNSGLTSVQLPDSVTVIEQYAFQYCSALTEVNLNKVEKLGSAAFGQCTSLTSIVIPDTIKVMSAEGIFSGCTKLANITMPNKVLKVSSTSFSNTAYYNTADNWQDGILYLGHFLISADKSTKTYVTIKDGTKVIADYAFAGNGPMDTVYQITFSSQLEIIGNEVFSGCRYLEKFVNIPTNLKFIGWDCFDGTPYISKGLGLDNGGIYFGNWLIGVSNTGSTFTMREGTIGIIDVPDMSHSWFKSVTNITLASTLQYIGDYVFANSTFATIEIPSSVTHIGRSVFTWSTVAEIRIKGTIDYIGSNAFNQCKGTIKFAMSSAGNNWASDWNFTYGNPLVIEWGVAM